MGKKKLVLQNRNARCEIKTSSDVTPKPKVSIIDPIDLNITFLLQLLSKDMQLNFSIDRLKNSCHTPRRNEQVAGALSYLQDWYSWAGRVSNYFNNRLFPVQSNHGLDLSVINGREIFIPVVPLFEENPGVAAEQSKSATPSTLFVIAEGKHDKLPATLPVGDVNLFLKEQLRSFDAKFEKLQKTFPSNQSLITFPEAKLLSVLDHSRVLCVSFSDGVDYIEQMLRNQLVSAIGKEVTPVEFSNYMTYHNRKLFKEEYAPQRFCYAIRRPDHYPEGILSIDCKLNDGSIAEPISTLVNHQQASKKPMRFTLSAAATVSFFGDRYLHAWMGHQFSGDAGGSFSLSARARQFSSFILLVGNIIAADLFDPKFATIIQNKDDILIPLLFEQIPTPKAFRDAIESLSPEQQDFAKAFRSMQLESTMFGVCIIQIKPQLEKLLNIPDDSLTKEIQLTQDLLNLFIEYQIPSDLISFDEDDHPNATAQQKIEIVKQHVKTMQEMIERSKKNELEEAKLKTQYEQPLLSKEFIDKPVSKSSTSMKTKKKYKKSAPSRAKVAKSRAAPQMLQQQQQQQQAPVKQAEPAKVESAEPEPEKQPSNEFDGASEAEGFDVTKIPAILDQKFEKYDTDSVLHSTIIKPGTTWNKKYQKALLSDPTATTLSAEDLKKEKNKTFDLLDALTRSGGLAIDSASLHVVLASTHCFDQTLMNTIIQDNVNPIEKLERSTLIVASTIQQTPPEEMISPEHVERVKQFSPAIFE